MGLCGGGREFIRVFKDGFWKFIREAKGMQGYQADCSLGVGIAKEFNDARAQGAEPAALFEFITHQIAILRAEIIAFAHAPFA